MEWWDPESLHLISTIYCAFSFHLLILLFFHVLQSLKACGKVVVPSFRSQRESLLWPLSYTWCSWQMKMKSIAKDYKIQSVIRNQGWVSDIQTAEERRQEYQKKNRTTAMLVWYSMLGGGDCILLAPHLLVLEVWLHLIHWAVQPGQEYCSNCSACLESDHSSELEVLWWIVALWGRSKMDEGAMDMGKWIRKRKEENREKSRRWWTRSGGDKKGSLSTSR